MSQEHWLQNCHSFFWSIVLYPMPRAHWHFSRRTVFETTAAHQVGFVETICAGMCPTNNWNRRTIMMYVPRIAFPDWSTCICAELPGHSKVVKFGSGMQISFWISEDRWQNQWSVSLDFQILCYPVLKWRVLRFPLVATSTANSETPGWSPWGFRGNRWLHCPKLAYTSPLSSALSKSSWTIQTKFQIRTEGCGVWWHYCSNMLLVISCLYSYMYLSAEFVSQSFASVK